MRLVVRLGAALAAVPLLLVAAPADAHGTDPRIVSVVDGISPPLPRAVHVQVRANLAAQIVADNPTDAPLEVQAPTGEVFLRISRAGVFANTGSPEFFATSNPNGATSAVRGPDHFVRISAGSSWGWYDHRLHPFQLAAPRDDRHQARLGAFEVPLRYAKVATTLRGHLEFRPLLGQFFAVVRMTPPGLTAQVLQGRLPGLFVTVTAPLTVLGRDGEPFLRSDGRRLTVNTASRTYLADQQARGVPAGPVSPGPHWRPVGASSYTWLDDRLQYASAAPPERALHRSGSTTVAAWQIPVVTGAGTELLAGDVRWVPTTASSTAAGAARGLPEAVGAVVLLAVAAAGWWAVRRRRPGSSGTG